MRLKRLEIVGFKSFANKIKLEFDEGITAIVGPNGSGKSNISDAVRWVLGEQSIKSLRGSRLEDVIFAGSKNKRPLGMAEVQLTLDNSDGFLPIEFREVTITRRVYRSGDSEFMINRQSCRLRDIQDLFTDTGLGREGYSIIGQGQIDAILSASSEERRVLLEETAGIVKYRNRKEEARRKIERTDQDLLRVSDILTELRGQLGPLEEQAQKARQYQGWARELEDHELDLMSIDFKRLSTREEQLTKELSEEQVAGDSLSKRYQEQEQILNNAQYELNKIEHDLDQYQNHVSTVSEEINRCMQEISLFEERSQNNLQQQTQYQSQKNQLQAELVKLQEATAQNREQLTKLEAEHRQAAKELSLLETEVQDLKVDYQTQRDQLEIQKNDFIEFVRTLADARNFQLNYQQQTESLTQQIIKTENEQKDLETTSTDISSEIVKMKQRQDNLMSDKLKFVAQIKQLQQKIAATNERSGQIVREEKTAILRLQQLQSRLQALEDLEVDYEGYNYSVRRLMQAKIANVELLGTVADVIRVPEGLETAIEVALGAGLQNVITATGQDAKLAIEWLKTQKAGRATFLPLDNIQGRTFPDNYQQYWQREKCLGSALDLLEFDQRFFPAIASLLGRVVVVEDLDTALELQKVIPSFSRIVTRSGEVIMPNGSLTGGSMSRKSGGLLARKNEIESLKAEIVKQEEHTESLTMTKSKIDQELQENNQSLASVQRTEYQIQVELESIDAHANKLEQDLIKTKRLCDAQVNQLREYQSVLGELTEQSAASLDNIGELENEECKRRQAISQLEASIPSLESKVNEANEKLTEEKINLANKMAEVNQHKDRLESALIQLQRTEEQLQSSTTEYQQLQKNYEELQSLLVTNKTQYESLQHQKVVALDQLQNTKQARVALQAEISETNSELKKLQSSLAKIDKRIYNIQLELDRVKIEYEQINEKLREREIGLAAIKERQVSHNPQLLKDQIQILRGKIRDLGVVNLGSLTEYESVKERVTFLDKQLNDLINAKETLHQVVNEIDATSSERFLDTYNCLRTEFQEMFAKLFQGGAADIILTDPEDILATGVDIVAQPPGKKQQKLSLLSGGERSLTAIALLLAIRKVKPTPFCILDEIDAALDDANLSRFAEQMKEFSKTTQFLAITHRQGTMEIADRLYGVTMSEDATSQLISVQLAGIKE